MKNKTKIFEQRLDFYWQYIAVYAIIILAYSLIKGSINEGTLTFFIYDPIVILLMSFLILASIPMLYNYYKARSIEIGKDFIAFRSRFQKKSYDTNDIEEISHISEKLFKVRRTTYKVIKIKVKNRRLPIKVRPGNFWKQDSLVKAINELRDAIAK